MRAADKIYSRYCQIQNRMDVSKTSTLTRSSV